MHYFSLKKLVHGLLLTKIPFLIGVLFLGILCDILAVNLCLSQQACAQSRPRQLPTLPPPRKVAHSQIAPLGIRRIEGKYLTLFTDLPTDPQIENLPKVFDLAVPQWAAYFHISPKRLATWKMQGYLIQDPKKFAAAGLMPGYGRKNFANGFSINHELWLYEQPSPYYRRHLLLHEGTHGFMVAHLGHCGPGWYMEGMAELLGTHHYDPQTKKLQLNFFPSSKTQVPYLGRIRLIQEAVQKKQILPLEDIFRIDNRYKLKKEAYAWCWSLTTFLERHPAYQKKFSKLASQTRSSRFTKRFRQQFTTRQWSNFKTEWKLFVTTLVHGHDIAREAITFVPGKRLDRNLATTVTLATNQGWQSTGIWLAAGESYTLTANGRYLIHQEPDGTAWACEPNGITLRYENHRPLGQLLATLDTRDTSPTNGIKSKTKRLTNKFTTSGFLQPFAVGLQKTITPSRSGTLYLRINDSPAQLSENQGELQVTLRRHSPPNQKNAP